MQKRLIVGLCLALMFLLTGAPAVQMNTTPSVVSAAAPATCTPNPSNTLTIADAPGGAPNSFNLLTVIGSSGYWVEGLEYPYGAYPIWSYNGNLDWSTSLTNVVTHNANYTQWLFHVKDNITWSNGQPVTAQDLLNNFSPNFALNPNYDIPGIHSEISNAFLVNTSTVEFDLNQSDAHLPEEMSPILFTSIYPPSFVSQGPNFNGFGTTVSDGPFYLANYTSGSSQATLLRNPYYKPLPNVCEIVVQFIESQSQTAAYIQGGTADFAEIDNTEAAALSNLPNIHVVTEAGASDSLLYYFYNYPENMTAFRQALAYSINYSQIVKEAYAGLGEPANNAQGGIFPGAYGYSPSQQSYSYDPQKALSLLSSIGINKGSDGYLQFPNGTDITLPLWVENTHSDNVIAAQVVENNLQSLGFKLDATTLPLPTISSYMHKNLNNVQHGIVLLTSQGVIFGNAYINSLPAWQSYISLPGRPNWEYPPSVNQQYNTLAAGIRATSNATQEVSLLQQVQNLNAQNLPVIQLGYGDLAFAYSTTRWTGWASPTVSDFSDLFNVTMFATLKPVGSSTSVTAGSSTATSSSQVTSSTAGQNSLSTTSTTNSVSSSSTATSTNNNTLIAIAAVVIIVAIAVSVIFTRRRKPT